MRLYSIINDFVSNNNYLTVDFFVRKYDVSKRTIQNDLSYLMQVASKNGFNLNFRREYGYILEVLDQKKLDRFIRSLQSDSVLDSQHRIRAIGFNLLMSNKYLTMEQLAEEFNVSIATIKKEVKQT